MNSKTPFVSYWCGLGNEKNVFKRILEYTINENGLGNFVPSIFCNHIGIINYEPEYFGGQFYPKPITLSMLMNGEFAKEALIKKWPNIKQYNCKVILYGNEIKNTESEFDLAGINFKFLGSYVNTQ